MSITVKTYQPEVGVGVTTKKATIVAFNHNPPPSSKRGLRRFAALPEDQRNRLGTIYGSAPKRTRDKTAA